MLDVLAERSRVGLACADVGDGFTPVIDPVLGTIDGPATVSEGFEPAAYPHGTLLMARRDCISEIGLFDERYFAYCEEADLGMRATAAGWQIGLIRGARVRNQHVNTPAPIIDYLKERNILLFLADHFGWRKLAIRTVLSLWQLVAGAVRPATRAEYWSGRARLFALRDAALRRWGPPPAEVFALGQRPGDTQNG
jgi:GT2 family glycosyltransferase